ncbi:MAG: ABC transporter substrate-binding protein [Clostridia bacterium]
MLKTEEAREERMLHIKPKWSAILMAIAVILFLGLAVGCGNGEPAEEGAGEEPAEEGAGEEPAEEEPAEEGDKEPIIITDTQFQTLWINNALAQFIIEEGYGYPVEIVNASVPVMNQSLQNGETHLHMELWRFNMMDWYTEATESGDVIDLGPTYEGATQGWYVPRYVIEGDEERDIEPMAPDLESVDDLPDYWEVFEDREDPSKGAFINSIHEWECTQFNTVKMEVYGLTEYYNVRDSGGAAALDTALVSAYKKGEPVLGYYWEPTWLMGQYDFVKLEEPEYDEEVWAELRRAVDGEIDPSEIDEACAYQTHTVNKGIYSGLKDRAPEVVEFLEKMDVKTDALNETAAYMETEDASAEEAAIWYFENFEEIWREWLPEDVEQKIEEALKEEGADL